MVLSSPINSTVLPGKKDFSELSIARFKASDKKRIYVTRLADEEPFYASIAD
jgi:hypothetical protein